MKLMPPCQAWRERETAASWVRADQPTNAFTYNAGAEYSEATQWLETYYRPYDPALGRFNGIDVMAGSFTSWTPYQYAYNDPVYYNDPMGDSPSGMPSDMEFMYENYAPPSVAHYDGNLDWASQYRGMWSNYMTMSTNEFRDYYSGLTDQQRFGMANQLAQYTYRKEVKENNEWIPDGKGGSQLLLGPLTDYYVLEKKSGENGVNAQSSGGTWYYMSRDGSPHGMVYDPTGGYIYEINGVPGQDNLLDRLERVVMNSLPSNNTKAKISVAYQYKEGSLEWDKLWAREDGNTYLLSPVTVPNPAAATAWFQGQTGNPWNYFLGGNNCMDYSISGLNAGNAGIGTPWWPHPSSFPIAPTMQWTAGQPYPVPIGK